MMEGSAEVSRFFEGIEDTSDITLIASIVSPKSILDMWKGAIKFLAVFTSETKWDKKLKKWFRPINGNGVMFPSLCSQFNTAVAMAYRVFGCRSIMLVGNELSFKTNDDQSKYYVEGTDKKDIWERKPHPDIYGNVVYTTYNFITLKMALEDYLQRLFVECVNVEGRIPYFLNASEGGIFGVSKRHGNLFVTDPDGNRYNIVWQLTLDMAIKQARNIMKYGTPITLDSVIKRPSFNEVRAYA
jgi:hypothetical protein